jgi:DNA-binding transcriptional MerR regulator
LSYAPKLAAALSGATIRQLAYWRKPGPDGQAVLTPEYSATRPIDYSFRDVIALRTCVRLRQEASLQKIRRALDALRVDLGLRDHLASYQLVAAGS